MKKHLYRTEIWHQESNDWIILSRHRNEENAVINAEVTSKSRKCDARVIYNGNVIFSLKGGI
jgi:hypothetical protein